MTVDVLQAAHNSGAMARMSMVRSTSPKAVLSDSSPIKKRRIDALYSVDYRHRRGSRSGDLALLRVLSAPTTSLPTPMPTQTVSRSSFSALRHRAFPEARQRYAEKHSALRFQSSLQFQTIELTSEHFVFLRPQSYPRKQSSLNMEAVIDSPAPEMHKDVSMETSTVLEQAETLAGPTAMHFKQIIPPQKEDSVMSFFNPEIEPSITSMSSPSSGGQLAMPVTADSPLRQRIEALPRGGSLLFMYPTKRGAEMFNRNVLLPVLDPLVRRVINEHGLSEDAARKIHNNCLATSEHIMDFEELKGVCEQIVSTVATHQKKGDGFEVKLARQAITSISSAAWKSQWIKQSREMIRETLVEGLHGRGGGATLSYGGIVHPKASIRVAEELLANLKEHQFGHWEKPTSNEIEVGVFVFYRH